MELNSIKRIATQLNMQDVYKTLESRLSQLSCDQTRISIVGGSNVGKTTLINALANTNVEVSSLPTMKTYRVCIHDGGDNTVKSDSEWLQEKNIEIWEMSEQDQGNDPKLIDYGLFFSHSDICVMLLNSMSALSRSEMSQLDVLDNLGIPTLVVLSKADQLMQSDYKEVENYVIQKTRKYNAVKVLQPESPVSVGLLAEQIKSIINELLEEANPQKNSRAAISRVYITDALASLSEECNKKIVASEESKARVENLTNEKRTKMSDSTTIWLKLQTALTQRKNETASK